MAEQDSGEKTEEPTQKRLDKAEEDGQILRSQEFSVAMMVILSLFAILLLGKGVLQDLLRVYQFNLGFTQTPDTDQLLTHVGTSINVVIPRLSLFFLICVLIAIAGNVVLGGVRFNLKSIWPKMQKLNPATGLKRMFGGHALYELLKGTLKTLLILLSTVLTFNQFRDDIFMLGVLPEKLAIEASGRLVATSVIIISLALLLIAMLDVPVKIREFRERLMMTRQEIKDEYKESEGRPEVRSRIRQRQREIALGKMMKAIENADVIVTNPQHFAVALSYVPGSSAAPIVLGKGIDHVALQIRKKAEALAIPVFEAPALARALYFTSRVEDQIPEELYYAVAEVIAYVFSMGSSSPYGNKVSKPMPLVPESMLFDTDGNPMTQ